MARDCPEKEQPTTDDAGDDGLSRRSYLKLGASAATFAGLAGYGAVSRGSAQDLDAVDAGADPTGNEPINGLLDSLNAGDSLYFPPGEYLVSDNLAMSVDNWTLEGDDATLLLPEGGIRLSGDGWTFDGFEIDYSGQTAIGTGIIEGADWTFGNVVFRGTRGDTGNNTLLSPRVPSGSSALMHDVYAHVGAAQPGEESGSKLMWSGSNLEGSLTIRRLWGEQWAENTTYVSAAPGAITFEDCFFRNTNVAGVRGGKDVTVQGCTFVKDGPIPVQPSLNGSETGGAVARGIWANMNRTTGGQFVIEDNDFYYTDSSDAGPMIRMDGPADSVALRNNRFHSSFKCPAMTIGDDSFSLSGSGNELSGSAVVYRSESMFSQVDGEAADPTPPMPAPPEPGTTPGSSTTTETSTETATATDGDWKSLTIRSDDDETTSATFTFTVSGDLEHLTPEDPVVQSDHGVDGSTATEDVWSEDEKYRFTGSVTDFQIDGPATVLLEGEQVSIDSITATETATSTETQTATSTETSTETQTATETSTETATSTETTTSTDTTTLPNTIVIEGSGNRGSYSFTVSGDLEKHDSLGTNESSDVIYASTAQGEVYGGSDAYRFSGELQSLELNGAASISFDDGS